VIFRFAHDWRDVGFGASPRPIGCVRERENGGHG